MMGNVTVAPGTQDPDADEDAVLEGDRPVRPATARAALRHRPFAILWTGTFSSNVGTWMQNVALGVLAFQLTHSATFVALIGFAQLAPILLLGAIGGALADALDRRMLLVVTNAEQLIFSLVLAWVAYQTHPGQTALFLTVLAVGIGNALSGPSLSSMLPSLVEREEITGAVSLFSFQVNLSRVAGPAIGGILLPFVHAWGIFAINAVTYLFAVIAALLIPRVRVAQTGESPFRRLLNGFSIARHDPLVRRVLATITAFSLICLPFIGLMPVIAAVRLGMSTTGLAYGLLYGTFGLGAALGALGVGTVFAGHDQLRLSRISLAVFALLLAAFGLVRQEAAGYPVVLLMGAAYFSTTTGMLSALQSHITEEVRGRVMALWMMGFGGTVPIGLLVFGKAADLLARGGHANAATLSIVLVSGAVVAGLMAALDAVGSRLRER
jgi:MFS family permease